MHDVLPAPKVQVWGDTDIDGVGRARGFRKPSFRLECKRVGAARTVLVVSDVHLGNAA